MREGKFTPEHTLDRYINDRQTDYNGARAIINSRDTATADPIANLARHWEAEVPALVRRIQRDGITPLPAQAAQAPAMLLARGDASQDVFEMQQYLAALGMQDGRNRNIAVDGDRSEEHTSELQSLMRISYAVFCLKKKKKHNNNKHSITH